MRLFILLSLISFNVFADGLGSFEKYKENFPLLLNDINRMETVVQKNDSPLYKDMLKDMNVFRVNYDHLSNPLKLESFYQDAVDNGWLNIQRMTKELIPLCESQTNKNIVLCKTGLDQMRAFALGSKLSVDNKESLATFIDDYVSQLNAFNLINAEFISNFNKNSEAINLKIKEAAQKIPPMVVKIRPVSTPAVVMTKEIYSGKENYLLFGAGIALVLGMGIYGLNLRKKKIIKDFYAKLFTLAKKNNIQLKVFGQISEAKLVDKIQLPFLNTIYLSRGVSNKAQVKFKNKGSNVSVEVNYATSRAIQNVMSLPKEKALKDGLESLQQIVEMNGGEFVFSNRFNSLGELVQSSFLLHLPK